MDKKRYDLEIAGVEMAIISDEREDFVYRLASEIDANIKAITGKGNRCSKLDAAILCALDYASDKVKAEKRVRNLEAQVALYDANLRRMKEENARLKGESFVCAAPRSDADEIVVEALEDVIEEAEHAEVEVEVIEETAAAVQMEITEEESVEEAAPAVPEKREDKLRLIESLLKNRGN